MVFCCSAAAALKPPSLDLTDLSIFIHKIIVPKHFFCSFFFKILFSPENSDYDSVSCCTEKESETDSVTELTAMLSRMNLHMQYFVHKT